MELVAASTDLEGAVLLTREVDVFVDGVLDARGGFGGEGDPGLADDVACWGGGGGV